MIVSYWQGHSYKINSGGLTCKRYLQFIPNAQCMPTGGMGIPPGNFLKSCNPLRMNLEAYKYTSMMIKELLFKMSKEINTSRTYRYKTLAIFTRLRSWIALVLLQKMWK